MISIKYFLTLSLLTLGLVISQGFDVLGQSSGDSGYLFLLKKDQLKIDANGIPSPLPFNANSGESTSKPVVKTEVKPATTKPSVTKPVATKPVVTESKELVVELKRPTQKNFEIRNEIPKAIEGKYEPTYATVVDKILVKEAYAKWEPSDEFDPNCVSANKDDCRIPKLKNYPAVYKEVEKTALVEPIPTVFYVKMVDTIVVKQASAKWEFSDQYDPNCISANKEDCRIPKLVNYPAEYGYKDRLVEWVNYKERNYEKEAFVKKFPDVLLPVDKSKANGMLANSDANKGKTVSKAVSKAVSKEELESPEFPALKKDESKLAFMENVKPYEPRFKTVKEEVLVKEAYAVWEPSDQLDPNCVSANKEDCRVPKLKNYPAVYEVKERQKEIPALAENYIVTRMDSKLVKPAYSEWVKGTKFDPNCVSANKEDCLIPVLKNYPPTYEAVPREESWILYKGKFYTEEEFVKMGVRTLVVRVELEEPEKKAAKKPEAKPVTESKPKETPAVVEPKAKPEVAIVEEIVEERPRFPEEKPVKGVDELRNEVVQAKTFPTPSNRDRLQRSVEGKLIDVNVSKKQKSGYLNVLKPGKYKAFESNGKVSTENASDEEMAPSNRPSADLKSDNSESISNTKSLESENQDNNDVESKIIESFEEPEQEYFTEEAASTKVEKKSFFKRIFSIFKRNNKEEEIIAEEPESTGEFLLENLDNINIEDKSGIIKKDGEAVPVKDVPQPRKERRVIPGNTERIPGDDKLTDEVNVQEEESIVPAKTTTSQPEVRRELRPTSNTQPESTNQVVDQKKKDNSELTKIAPEKEKAVAVKTDIPTTSNTTSTSSKDTEKEVIRQFVANYSKQKVSLIQKVQVALKAHGYAPDRLDNKLGKNTMSELAKFQADNGLVTGGLNAVTLKKLGIEAE